MFVDLLTLCALLYAVMIVTMTFAAAFATYPADNPATPSVSLVIAARNEEEHIGRCLESITRLRYPAGMLEVIVVNDHSTDRTADVVRGFSLRDSRIRLMEAEASTGTLRGKANAVSQGIDVARGEIILMTDADCVVPREWVLEMVKYYDRPEVGLVAGFTELRAYSPFTAMQAIDWFSLFSVAAGTTKMGYPVTAVGTNLSVRRAAYNAVGGFRGIPFSVTEDYALVHAITTTTRFRARFPMDSLTLVLTEPCTSLRELFLQKKRWFSGGRGMDGKSLVLFSIPYVFNLLLLFSPFFAPAAIVALAFAIKIAADLGLVLPALIRFRALARLPSFPLYEIYFFVYVLVYPPLVLFDPGVIWKDRSFGHR